MQDYNKVRRMVLIDGKSRRAVSRELGINRDTIKKMLEHSIPPGYRRQKGARRSKLAPFIPIIEGILEQDKTAHWKQRHTNKRIIDRLRDEYDYPGGKTIVSDYLCQYRRRRKEVFVPLHHSPGKAQVDFGEAYATINGVRQKIHYFVLDLPQSDHCFLKAYPRERTEAWLDGHVEAFRSIGGVPTEVLYDNSSCIVRKIEDDKTRLIRPEFEFLQSHYLFKMKFGRPGKGNDKGKVEGMVGFYRREFLVPEPKFSSYNELNAYLYQCSKRRRSAILRGHKKTIGERFKEDQEHLLSLPADNFSPCHQTVGHVNGQLLVRYDKNDYSVPRRWAYQEVHVKGFVDQVVISCGTEVIACHDRSYEKGDAIYDPLHYLSVLEQKVGAFDQAAPLQGWELPDDFLRMQRLLESRHNKEGKREYIQILRLMEDFQKKDVHHAVQTCLSLKAISYDAVKQTIIAEKEFLPVELDLSRYPYLPSMRVAPTNLQTYTELVRS